MRVINWEPFRDMDDVFDRFFADAFRRLPRNAAGRHGRRSTGRRPPT